jgi:hypothetical protein
VTHCRNSASSASACSTATIPAPDIRYAHAAFREVSEVAFALPFTFEWDDYVQILTGIAEKLGPALGWQPRS